MIFTDRSIRFPKTGRNLSKNPSTTRPAIAALSRDSAARTTKTFFAIQQL
jgi:hypothetical protein